MRIGSGEAILAYQNSLDQSRPTGLWWCIDSEDVFFIKDNAVCKSIQAQWSDIDQEEIKILASFPYIFVCVPPCNERDDIVENLIARVPIPILIPCDTAFNGHRNVRELVRDIGIEAMGRLLYGAIEVPMQGLINLADVDCTKRLNENRILSGFLELDSSIGGFIPGDLTVWTGKRGEGKSTLLGQIQLEAINQGHKVCVYSGEMPKMQFKISLLQQAAGELFITERIDEKTGHIFYDVDRLAIKYIDDWWNKCLFLTDIQCNDAHNEDTIIKLFEYAHRRHGCDIFLVDNIMTAELKNSIKIGYYQAQSQFTGRLVAFAKKNNVHVHLVAHPRKTDKRIEADDVGGSSDITNRADNVIKIERIKEENLEQAGCSMLLTVLKNREFGALSTIKMDFNKKSRRFYSIYRSDDKKYSWEIAMRNDILK